MPATQTNVLELIYSIFISEKFIAAVVGMAGGTIATFVAPWTRWHFREKELKRENRKEKIEKWRFELNKLKSISELHSSPLYNELKTEIPEQERKKLFSNSAIECNIIGGVVLATDVDNRIISRFHEIISQKEKEWRLI